MSAWLDISYLRQISYRLDRYKEKQFSPYLANTRCPICGDSEKKSKKARGYFYQKKDAIFYRCFNCDASISFRTFLKDFDKNLYNRYALDSFRENTESNHVEVQPQVVPPATKSYVPDIMCGAVALSSMNNDSEAYQYVIKRKIPEQHFSHIFFVENFFAWASEHSDRFNHVEGSPDHPRVIFPWYSKDGVMFGYHARSLHGEEPKYYSIVIDENTKEKIFGLDRLDEGKRVYVVEGPIDSLYLPNAVAVGTSALYRFSRPSAQDVVYIPDRDVRNKEVMKIVKKMIDQNKKVCMLPDCLPGKDIGEFIENNLSVSDIVDIINNNTYQGLEAKLKFTQWRKINE